MSYEIISSVNCHRLLFFFKKNLPHMCLWLHSVMAADVVYSEGEPPEAETVFLDHVCRYAAFRKPTRRHALPLRADDVELLCLSSLWLPAREGNAVSAPSIRSQNVYPACSLHEAKALLDSVLSQCRSVSLQTAESACSKCYLYKCQCNLS